MQTQIVENIYTPTALAAIQADAEFQLASNSKINKVGNKFAKSCVENVVVDPLVQFHCSHWYVAYFQHVIGVYPHTDNDTPTMSVVGIIPLSWETGLTPHTMVYRETSDSKQILKSRHGLTLETDFIWKPNCGLFFAADRFHSSDDFQGSKTGLQIIGYA